MLGFDALSKRSRVARRLVLNAAAKINLALEVLGKRDDGYHEVATVMQAVDLSDRLVIEDAEGLELRVSAPDLPSDGRDLAVRAAHALREATAVSRGARITLDKRIPAAAGRPPSRAADGRRVGKGGRARRPPDHENKKRCEATTTSEGRELVCAEGTGLRGQAG